MGCLVGIDFGEKRTGIAHTDPFQLIATGLTTLSPTKSLIFLKKYVLENEVEAIIIGEPKQKDGNFSSIEKKIKFFIKKLKIQIPNIKVVRYDERYTSKLAKQTIIEFGIKKSKRRNKSLIDQVSATIILQSYLELIKHQK